MKIAVYGGSFDPPHSGHVEVARAVMEELSPDILMIVPCLTMHGKSSGHLSDYADIRLALCREAFGNIEGATVSDTEIKRGAPSYTADTLKELREAYPGAGLVLVTGEDKLQSIESWKDSGYILENCTLAVASRENTAHKTDSVSGVVYLDNRRIEVSSESVRELLKKGEKPEALPGNVYSLIIKNRWYDAVPDLDWLRERSYSYHKAKRIPHVAGCEKTALELAEKYGCDCRKAATAAILHDITKKLDYNAQLILCSKYDIICDDIEKSNDKLLHAKTGAYFSKDLFGIEDDVFSAIFWHTTGKPEMSLLEKVIYIADYIEPTRSFPGVDSLRRAAYTDIDEAMALGLKMSLEDIISRGVVPHKNTQAAYDYYKEITDDRKHKQ